MILSYCPICHIKLIPGAQVLSQNNRFVEFYDCPQCPFDFYLSFLDDVGFHPGTLNCVSLIINQIQINAFHNQSFIYLKPDPHLSGKHLATVSKSYFDWNWSDLEALQQDVKLILAFS